MDTSYIELTGSPDREIITIRKLSATIEKALKAWTDPTHLSKWCGSKVFTSIDKDNTRVEFKMIFPTVEDCQNIKQFVTEKNEENMDRLEIKLQNII